MIFLTLNYITKEYKYTHMLNYRFYELYVVPCFYTTFMICFMTDDDTGSHTCSAFCISPWTLVQRFELSSSP